MNGSPDPAPEAGWEEAAGRVRGYLDAHGVVPPLLDELASRILGIARERARAQPDREPTALAVEVAMSLIYEWIEHIVGTEDGETPGRRFAHERASVHLARIPGKWPGHFLSLDEVPADLAARLKTIHVQAGPDLEFSKMTLRPIDLGPAAHAAGSTWRTFDRLPALRALAGWAIYVALLTLAFLAIRP